MYIYKMRKVNCMKQIEQYSYFIFIKENFKSKSKLSRLEPKIEWENIIRFYIKVFTLFLIKILFSFLD